MTRLAPPPRALPRRSLRLALAAALLVAGLTGCEPPGPTGIDRVLFFVPSPTTPYVGDTFRMAIPDHVHTGDYFGGKGLVYYRGKTYDYAFEGTSLAVTPPAFVSVVATSLDAEGWKIDLRCESAGASERLSVQVLAAGVERYADGYYVACSAR